MILVKVRGRKYRRAMIHAYNRETGTAICRSWPRPGREWELQDVDWSDVPVQRRCSHCNAKLHPKPPKPRLPSAKEREHQAELDRLKAWNEAIGSDAI